MTLCFIYIFLQIGLFIVFWKNKRNFNKNIVQKIIIVIGNLIVLFFQVGITIFVHSDTSKYDVKSASVFFSTMLDWAVVVSILTIFVGMLVFIFKSRLGYFLCPFGLNVFFFTLSVQIAAGKWYFTKQDFLFKINKLLVFYLLVALFAFAMSFFILQQKSKGSNIYEKK